MRGGVGGGRCIRGGPRRGSERGSGRTSAVARCLSKSDAISSPPGVRLPTCASGCGEINRCADDLHPDCARRRRDTAGQAGYGANIPVGRATLRARERAASWCRVQREDLAMAPSEDDIKACIEKLRDEDRECSHRRASPAPDLPRESQRGTTESDSQIPAPEATCSDHPSPFKLRQCGWRRPRSSRR